MNWKPDGLPSSVKPKLVKKTYSHKKIKNASYNGRVGAHFWVIHNTLLGTLGEKNLIYYNCPWLLFYMQLYSEFHRITNQSLPFTFFAALDKYTPQLLKLYKRRKSGSFGEKMAAVLMAYEERYIFHFMHYNEVKRKQWFLTPIMHILCISFLVFHRTRTTSVRLEQQPWLAYRCIWGRIDQMSSKLARYFCVPLFLLG